jgi:hypothetical protein
MVGVLIPSFKVAKQHCAACAAAAAAATTTAEYVPYFLKLFVDAALLQLDAATLRAMRPKRRVLLVRFLAKALLCPYYR